MARINKLLFFTNIQTNVYRVESTQNQKWQSESRNVPVCIAEYINNELI